MKVLVFLGSRYGNSEVYREACIEVADWISNNNHSLVYGGNANGLMGVLTNRVLENGSEAIGVMPGYLKGIEDIHLGLTDFIETETMQERKDKMRELSDICIAIPGGPGTMEEITEAYSLYIVGQNTSPCIVYNKDNYYDDLRNMYDKMLEKGFLTLDNRKKLLFSDNFEEINKFIEENQNEKYI